MYSLYKQYKEYIQLYVGGGIRKCIRWWRYKITIRDFPDESYYQIGCSNNFNIRTLKLKNIQYTILSYFLFVMMYRWPSIHTNK